MTKLRFMGITGLLLCCLCLFVSADAPHVIARTTAGYQRVISPNDSADLPDGTCGAFWVGGSGNVNVIAAGDGTTCNGAVAANAATITVLNTAGLPSAYASTATAGQYVIGAEGGKTAEVISGYIAPGTNVITVTVGGGTGGNTVQYAHISGTMIAGYTLVQGTNAGQIVPIQARRVMNLNTTATNMLAEY